MNHEVPSGRAVIAGGLWVGAGFVGQQGIAVLRTLVLARLLTPEDFGLVGVVTLTLFAGWMLTEWSLESALIQRADLPARFVHTAWTLQMLRGVGLFLLLQLVSPWVAGVFGRPDAEPLLRVGAVSFLLAVVPMVPSALLLRELRFRQRVLLDVTRETVGTLSAVALALWLGSAWALLVGLLAGQAVAAAQVWSLHGFRPGWMVDRAAALDYWEFGRHLYVGGLLGYLVTRGDDITVGKLRGVAELGQYQVAFGIAETLTRGLGEVISKAVFPAYARLTAQGPVLADAFARVWSVLLLVLLPISVGLMLFPEEILLGVLGGQWRPAVAPFAVLVVAESLRALAAACGILVLAGGRTGYLSRIKVGEAACFGLLIVPMTAQWGMVGAAWCLVIVYGFSLMGHLYGAQRVVPVAARIATQSWEPCLVTALLAALTWGLARLATLGTPLCLVLWIGLWGAYLWWRHARLLIMVRDALWGKP